MSSDLCTNWSQHQAHGYNLFKAPASPADTSLVDICVSIIGRSFLSHRSRHKLSFLMQRALTELGLAMEGHEALGEHSLGIICVLALLATSGLYPQHMCSYEEKTGTEDLALDTSLSPRNVPSRTLSP